MAAPEAEQPAKKCLSPGEDDTADWGAVWDKESHQEPKVCGLEQLDEL